MKITHPYFIHSKPTSTIEVLLFFFFVIYFPGISQAANEMSPVGWVSYPKNVAGDSLVITREGQHFDYNDQEGLQPCDQVEFNRSKTQGQPPYIVLTLANSDRIRLTPEQATVRLPCDKFSFSNQLTAWLKSLSRDSDERYENALAGSRSVKTTTELTIPALVAESALVCAGDHPLHLRWQGGQAPYEVVLSSHATPDHPIIGKSGILKPLVSLPLSGISPGRYILTVKGVDGRGVSENNLRIVKADNFPTIPIELATSDLPSTVKVLFYADYLVSLEDGRYTLAALQQAASVSGKGTEVDDWLNRWGGIGETY